MNYFIIFNKISNLFLLTEMSIIVKLSQELLLKFCSLIISYFNNLARDASKNYKYSIAGVELYYKL